MSENCGCSCPPGQARCQPSYTDSRPNIYSSELPPWPTLEEIRKVVRDEVKKALGG